MQFVPRRSSGYVFGIIGSVALFTLAGCKKDNGPAPEPAKEVAAETKPTVNENPAPTAAVTPAPGTTETALPQAAPSASAAGALILPNKSPNGAGTPAEVAAAPANSVQNPPTPAETAVPAPMATPTTPEAPPPPPVESPKQNGQAFSVWLQSSGKYTAGQQGAVEAVVMPKGEFHCNQEYPYKFVTSSLSTGVTFPKSTYRAEGVSISPNRAVMRIPFVPQSAGEARIGGTFHFSVCTDQQCLVEKRDVFVTVNVQ